MASEPAAAERIVGRFLDAVERRDATAAGACFTASALYRNMPHTPVTGPDGVRAMLEPILTRATRVRWDVVTAAYHAHRGWVERIDRFWVQGTEYSIECNAVVEVDPRTGLIAEWRDYVDLGVWRERLGVVLHG